MSFYSSPSDFSGPNPRTQRFVNGSLGTSRETTCSSHRLSKFPAYVAQRFALAETNLVWKDVEWALKWH